MVMSTLKSTLLELVDSKKFLVMLVTLIAQFAGHYGFDIDQEKMIEFLSPLYAYVLAQGVADHGKERKS